MNKIKKKFIRFQTTCNEEIRGCTADINLHKIMWIDIPLPIDIDEKDGYVLTHYVEKLTNLFVLGIGVIEKEFSDYSELAEQYSYYVEPTNYNNGFNFKGLVKEFPDSAIVAKTEEAAIREIKEFIKDTLEQYEQLGIPFPKPEIK